MRRPVTTTLLLLASAAGAAAQLPAPAELAAGACFGRVYDDAHFATHPTQSVGALHLRFPATDGAKAAGGRRDATFDIAVRLRGRTQVHTVAGACTHASGRYECWLPSEGGWFRLTLDGELLRLAVRDDSGLTLEGKAGTLQFGTPGSDDRTFRLPKAAADACRF